MTFQRTQNHRKVRGAWGSNNRLSFLRKERGPKARYVYERFHSRCYELNKKKELTVIRPSAGRIDSHEQFGVETTTQSRQHGILHRLERKEGNVVNWVKGQGNEKKRDLKSGALH